MAINVYVDDLHIMSHTFTKHIGDKILLKDQNKKTTLAQNWIGPYEIISIHDNENITIKKGRKNYRTHINNVKKFSD